MNTQLVYVDKNSAEVQNNKDDQKLISQLEEVLELTETDMTIFFRNLSQVTTDDDCWKAFKKCQDSFYKVEEVKGYTLPFHTLYIDESPIVSIMEDHEPKTGTEKNRLMEIVNHNVKLHLPYYYFLT